MLVNAMTVDVEDYYQVSAFAKNIDKSEWDKYPSRV
ncbi:MAG: polysaccharide deacetylase family protein, partial [Candidatus Thiodiazotropha taylori]|nr:polysaccharide deacetylase family protein [Candidatus Thiodiazotropha taylori]MCW4332882.1 polysaccharide deacetylase family protein [Candidatus Thiodiazotropha endolucinida]